MADLTSARFRGNTILGQCLNGTHFMKKPAVGTAVALVQQALIDLGWDIPDGATGNFLDQTHAAVQRFQVGHLLDDDGIVGKDTIGVLDTEIAFYDTRGPILDQWLSPGLSGVFSAVGTAGIFFHASGAEAYAALNTALATCFDERAFVVLAGWGFQENTELVPGVTVRAALERAASAGASVRAIWNHFPRLVVPDVGEFPLPGTGDNARPVQFIQQLPRGAAIHDARALHHALGSLLIPNPLGLPPLQLGMHHQKIWVVWNGDQLIAFVGGLDIDPNRVGPDALHDVQIQVHGPTAYDIYEVLRLRWQDHPDRPAGVDLPPLVRPGGTGSHRARVLTTFGDPTAFAGLNGPPYSFAPNGSKAIRQMLSHLIARSTRFIYVEDQYFVDEQIGVELAAAMPHLDAVIILFCDSPRVNPELYQAFLRRRKVLDHLAPFRDKLAVVVRKDRFVHAKTWIFDDEIAMVGSANVNRRGFDHDSEIAVAYGDKRPKNAVRLLREQLWSRHLLADAPAPGGAAADSLPLWQQPPAGSLVTTYDWHVGADPTPVPSPFSIYMPNDAFWQIVDPTCP